MPTWAESNLLKCFSVLSAHYNHTHTVLHSCMCTNIKEEQDSAIQSTRGFRSFTEAECPPSYTFYVSLRFFSSSQCWYLPFIPISAPTHRGFNTDGQAHPAASPSLSHLTRSTIWWMNLEAVRWQKWKMIFWKHRIVRQKKRKRKVRHFEST